MAQAFLKALFLIYLDFTFPGRTPPQFLPMLLTLKEKSQVKKTAKRTTAFVRTTVAEGYPGRSAPMAAHLNRLDRHAFTG